MTAVYLRVKNWKDWQHYKDREPPWVKLHGKLLRNDDFIALSEAHQWQLVRIWMVVSQSSRFTLDEKRRIVPVVVKDESAIRRATASLKKVPLGLFIEQGWLIELGEEKLVENPHGDSTALAPDLPGDSTLLVVEGREVEHFTTEHQGSNNQDLARKSLPVNDHLIDKLVSLCGTSADTGTEGVFRSYAKQLPESSLAKVIETTASKPVAQRAKYANGALQSELKERAA